MEEMKIIEKRLEKVEIKVDTLDGEVCSIKNNNSDVAIDLALIKKDYDYMKKSMEINQKSLERIEKKLDEHFMQPVHELNKIKWAILGAILIGIVAYLLPFSI